MDKKIVETFNGSASMNIDAQWVFFPSDKYGFVAVVEVNESEWMINDNGNMTKGDFETILKECIEIKKRPLSLTDKTKLS